MTAQSLFFPPLSSEDGADLRRQVAGHRFAAFDYLVAGVSRPEQAERLDGFRPLLRRFVQDLSALAAERSPAFPRMVDHWAPVFLLGRVNDAAVRDRAQLERLVENLLSLLVASHLQSPRPPASAPTFALQTDENGRIYDLLGNAWLAFDGEGFAGRRVEFEFSAADLTVRTEEDVLACPFGVPANGASVPRRLPFARSEPWGLPLVHDACALGADSRRRRREDEPASTPIPPLLDGLADAHAVLARLWPEVLDWVRALVPAFVDLGEPPHAATQRSESYGPGSPIFVSSAATALQLAESVVHELQHERLLLIADGRMFPRWANGAGFVSPWRQDIRPLKGLYLAVHAFLAVNELRLRALEGSAPSRDQALQLLQTHCMNLFASRTFWEHDDPSPAGRRILAQWARALADQHRALQAFVTPEMYRMVERFFQEHVEAVAAVGQPLNVASHYRDWEETARLAERKGAEGDRP